MSRYQKNIITGLVMLAACVPYACKIPYIKTSWLQSPLDSHDWIFLLLGFVTLGITLTGIKKEKIRFDLSALLFMVPFALIYLLGIVKHIHAVSIMGSILFAAATTWLLWGWDCFITLLPAFLVFCLSVTSTTYWLIRFLAPVGIGGLTAKFILSFIALAIAIIQHHFHYIPKKHSSLFASAVCAAFFFVAFVQSTNIRSISFIPDFSSCQFPSAIGRIVEPTQGDLQFFQGSELEKFYFATDDYSSINVLSLTLGSNVHQIHPPSHCLRAGGNQIQSEHILKTDLRVTQFIVTEITTAPGARQMLVWYWYANKELSTASFLAFRKAWNPHQEWHSYQISTPIHDDIKKARERLRTFISEVAQKTFSQTP